MQKQLQQFQSEEFGALEILMIDDKPFFPATESAKILGYTKGRIYHVTRNVFWQGHSVGTEKPQQRETAGNA